MAVITLTTDWRSDDFYAGAVKGMIIKLLPEAKIIDISHQVPAFSTATAAFLLLNSFRYYPEGSIHIVDVNSEASATTKHIAMRYRGHYFIAADNGGFGLILQDDDPEKVVAIETFKNEECLTFPALHTFAPAAAHLAAGKPMEELGETMNQLNRNVPLRATIGDAVISGSVIYIDAYQNAITNISHALFERIGKGRKFEIYVQSLQYKITRINHTYNETAAGELLAVFNSAGLLEIAINRGNAAELLNLKLNSGIRIKFNG